MMKNAFEVVSEVKSLINVSELLNHIDGKVYDFTKPLNSSQQDITVSTLTSDNEYIQQAIVNIRIHALNMSITLEDKTMDGTRPNLAHFDKITKIVTQLTDDQHRDSFWTEVRKAGEVFKQKDGSHVCLVQLDYYSINFNNN